MKEIRASHKTVLVIELTNNTVEEYQKVEDAVEDLCRTVLHVPGELESDASVRWYLK